MILLGNCLDILPTLPDNSVQCCVTSPHLVKVIAFLVSATMYPAMAVSTQGNEVTKFKPEFGITSPRFDVMCVKRFGFGFFSTTANATIRITGINLANNVLNSARRIETLTLWRAAVFIIRVGLSSSTAHSVAISAQIWLGARRFYAKYCSSLVGVSFTEKRIRDTLLAHIVIPTRKVFASMTGWNIKVAQLIVYVFRITVYKFTDVICRKLFNDILLIQPVAV